MPKRAREVIPVTLKHIRSSASGKPSSFCMVSARSMKGQIQVVEQWTKRSDLSRSKRPYNVLRLRREAVEYYIEHWDQVPIPFKIPLLQLSYVLKNPTDFPTSESRELPKEVQAWARARSMELTKLYASKTERV